MDKKMDKKILKLWRGQVSPLYNVVLLQEQQLFGGKFFTFRNLR